MGNISDAMPEKAYKDLRFTDDFMFGQVLTAKENLGICKDLAGLLTGKEVDTIKVAPVPQKAERFLSDGKGVRFDVYFKDESTAYDLEMQTTTPDNLNKRARYYGSMIDRDNLGSGDNYEELPNVFIVFICLGDPFGKGFPRYVFENRCIESPTLPLNDGVKIIYINATATRAKDKKDKKLMPFIDYLSGRSVEDGLVKRIDDAVQSQLNSEAGKEAYMTLLERDRRQRKQTIFELVSSGDLRVERAAELLKLSVPAVKKQMSDAGYKIKSVV